MYTHEQRGCTQQQAVCKVGSKVDGAVCACEGRIRKAERAAREVTYRAEELKWRIDGRAWPVHNPRRLR